MNKKKSIYIEIICLVGVFVILATTFILIDVFKQVNLGTYFGQNVEINYLEEDVPTANTIDIADFSKRLEPKLYRSINLTCIQDIKVKSISFNIDSNTEQIAQMKIYVNDEEIDSVSLLLTGKTAYYRYKNKIELKESDHIRIIIDSESDISISKFCMTK